MRWRVIALDTSRDDNGLFLFSKEIEKALFDSEVLRKHLTIEIKTPNVWEQQYTVIYRNKRNKSGQEKDNLESLKFVQN